MAMRKTLSLVAKQNFRSGIFCFSTQPYKIGFVGMGNVGESISGNLIKKGLTVTSFYDIDSKKGSHLPSSVQRAKSPRDVVEECDLIVTGLPKPENIKAAAEGDSGIIAGMKKGKTWIDHSSTDYEQTKVFASAVAAKEGGMLEAPITGGLEALKKGQMTVFVAGDKELAERFDPYLRISFQTIVYMGPIGHAQVAKIATNMLCATSVIAMGEIFMLAKKAGIDLHTFWNAVRASAGNGFLWETAGPLIFQGSYDPGFTMKLFCKDLHLGYKMCREHKVPIPLHALVEGISNQALAAYGDEAGCYIAPKLLEDACQDSFKTEGFDNWTYDVEHSEGSAIVKHDNIK